MHRGNYNKKIGIFTNVEICRCELSTATFNVYICIQVALNKLHMLFFSAHHKYKDVGWCCLNGWTSTIAIKDHCCQIIIVSHDIFTWLGDYTINVTRYHYNRCNDQLFVFDGLESFTASRDALLEHVEWSAIVTAIWGLSASWKCFWPQRGCEGTGLARYAWRLASPVFDTISNRWKNRVGSMVCSGAICKEDIFPRVLPSL